MHAPLSFQSRLRRSDRRSAFTLIEIILVLSIIAILMGAVIYNISGNLDDAKSITARTGIQSITTSLKRYEMSNINAPTTEQGLEALVNPPKNARGGMQLMKELPMDPWGQPFKYRNPGVHNTTSYDVFSMGPDKKEGTADDIGNWSDTKQ
ncbi:MAG TPA: type II secretion system major pseudopilin GspG [Chthoniobacterales bacterium]|jgi:general secretion pathway protein G